MKERVHNIRVLREMAVGASHDRILWKITLELRAEIVVSLSGFCTVKVYE